nr:MAG: putative capsid protein [Arizlama virus]
MKDYVAMFDNICSAKRVLGLMRWTQITQQILYPYYIMPYTQSRYQPRSYSGATTKKRRAIAGAKAVIQRLGALSKFRSSTAPAITRPPAYLRGSSQEIKCFDQVFVGKVLVPIGTPVAGDGGGAGTNDLTSGWITLNLPIQGSGVGDRIGNKITMKNIQMHFDIFCGAVPNVTFSAVRYLVVYDRQTNGAYPAIADLLLDAPTAATGFNSSINIASRDRYSILRDERIDIDAASDNIVQKDIFIKTPGLQTQYRSTTAGNKTIGDIATGAVYFIVFAKNVIGGVVYPVIGEIQSRVRYYD